MDWAYLIRRLFLAAFVCSVLDLSDHQQNALHCDGSLCPVTTNTQAIVHSTATCSKIKEAELAHLLSHTHLNDSIKCGSIDWIHIIGSSVRLQSANRCGGWNNIEHFSILDWFASGLCTSGNHGGAHTVHTWCAFIFFFMIPRAIFLFYIYNNNNNKKNWQHRRAQWKKESLNRNHKMYKVGSMGNAGKSTEAITSTESTHTLWLAATFIDNVMCV